MSSIDDRVVAMSFDNAKFEAGVTKTIATLSKLDHALKNIGSSNGLAGLEKAANKINLAPMQASIEQLKKRLDALGGTTGFKDVEKAANQTNFGPLGSAIEGIKGRLSTVWHAPAAALDAFKEKLGFRGADAGLNNIETAANKVKLAGPQAAAAELSKKLQFPGAEASFSNIEKASGKVHLEGVNNAISNVTKGFSILQGAAAVALGSIASKAAVAGGAVVKNLTIGPISDGLKEYETNLNSVQTILANTKASGAGLKEVNAALLELNKYSDQTIYNFSEMAKNIGTFTAAGVDLKTATGAIKGIANLAALSGSNSQQASTAMYQLSQAISAGRVSLQDWNSVVNAGMGGTVFQRALAQTAETLGTIKKGAVELKGPMKNVTISGQSFRESITAKPGEKSWLTSDVLTSTLKQFTGDLSDAELKAMGFNEAQIKSIQETAITAKKAATEVKTLSGVYDVVKESIGSGWSQTFQTIFGDFGEAKTLFTGVSTAITGFVGASAKARNDVLADWKELGGRTVLIKSIKQAFEALMTVIRPIKDAFREIFPRKTGQDLFELTKRFEHLTEVLKIGPETANNLKRTFAGLFAILDIGRNIVSGVVKVLLNLLGAATGGQGGIFALTGTIGDFLVSVDEALVKGGALADFFGFLGKVLSAPIKLLSDLAGALGSVFGSGGAASDVKSSVDEMTNSLTPMAQIVDNIKHAWDGFLGVLKQIGVEIEPIVSKIGDAFGGLGDAIADSLKGASFENVFTVIQTTLVGGIFLAIKRALGGGLKFDLGGGALKNLSGSLETLTGSLKAIQTQIHAQTLLLIATAIGALAVGVKLLSTIDPKRLGSAMTAVAIGIGQLVGAMFLLTKLSGGPKMFLTMPFIAGSLIMLAAAIDVLAIAMKVFSKMKWDELAKGLVGVGGALVAIGKGVALIPKDIIWIGPALLPIAVALNLIATAMKILGTMEWEAIAKGLVGIAGGLKAISFGVKMMGRDILLIGPGLVAVAFALNLLAGAVLAFGSMDLLTLAKGIGGIAVALRAIAFAIKTIPPNVALQAAGLVLLSVALTGIAGAIALMGGMKITTIAKGITAIGIAIRVLAVGLKSMTGTIGGAAALLGAATALAILVPVLGLLGAMKWTTILKGLFGLAAIFKVLAAAGKTAGPGLAALGYALLPLGAVAAIAGAGVYLFASGIAKLGATAPKSIAAVVAAFTAFIALLPNIIISFIKGLVDIAESIAALAPKIVKSMVTIIKMLLDVVIQAAPKMAQAVVKLIEAFLTVLVQAGPKIIEAGFHLLLALLKGIDDNIVQVTVTVASIITKFLGAIAASFPKIVASGLNLLVQFLLGLASKMVDVVASAVKVVVKFLEGITQNMPKIVKAGIDLLISFVKGITQNIGRLIDTGADFIVKLLKGIGDNVGKVAKAATDMVKKFFDATVKAALDLAEAGAKAVINFINGVADAIRKHAPELGKAGGNLGEAIIEGAIKGMTGMAGEFVHRALGIFGGLPKAVKHFFGIHSPSTMFIGFGENLMQGFSLGIANDASQVHGTLRSATDEMARIMQDSLAQVPHILDGIVDLDPVITPILDLTNVESGAKKLSDLTNVIPITAAPSYNHATAISSEEAARQLDSSNVSPPGEVVKEVSFTQYNNSPKALSTREVYRQTKNQLAQAKTVLGVP